MTPTALSETYRGYIDCLNQQDWERLGIFVAETVVYNGAQVGLAGYRKMLEGDFRAIPDLVFTIEQLVSEPPTIASRLQFDCTPSGVLFGYPVNGRRVRFAENVIYRFAGDRIAEVWSIIDKAAIARQL